jgi:hypothetical protein
MPHCPLCTVQSTVNGVNLCYFGDIQGIAIPLWTLPNGLDHPEDPVYGVNLIISSDSACISLLW